jgi:hypothetical protein
MSVTGGSPAEIAFAMVQPVAWQPGEVHRFWVRGQDDAPTMNWGRGAYVDVYVVGPTVGNPPGAPMMTSVGIEGTDVNITWTLSADDGAGDNDVNGYEIYSGSIYNTGRLGYLLQGSVAAGETYFVHPNVGIDLNSYFYVVVATDTEGFSTASAEQGAKLAYHYTPGVHLISLPLTLSTSDLATLLTGVDFNIAWWYDPMDVADPWKHYNPAKPVNDLTEYNNTRGMWLEVNTDSDLIFAGMIPSGTSIELQTGWNLIGYPSLASSLVSNKIIIPYDRLEGFDPTNPPSNLRLLTDTDYMMPGYGYWIKVSSPQTLVI